MPNPHFDVSIVQRSKRQSAIASAAYQSNDRLYSEYDLKFKDYRNKGGVVYTEIMLPVNAPSSYHNKRKTARRGYFDISVAYKSLHSL